MVWPVFEAMLANAVRICGAKFGGGISLATGNETDVEQLARELAEARERDGPRSAIG